MTTVFSNQGAKFMARLCWVQPSKNTDSILIQDSLDNRDGSIEIRNIEIIKFTDQSLTTIDL